MTRHPMNENTCAETVRMKKGSTGVSPYLAFGKKYAQISNMPVGLVQTSLGGSPMARWNPENGDLLQNMIDKTMKQGTAVQEFCGIRGVQIQIRNRQKNILSIFTAL